MYSLILTFVIVSGPDVITTVPKIFCSRRPSIHNATIIIAIHMPSSWICWKIKTTITCARIWFPSHDRLIGMSKVKICILLIVIRASNDIDYVCHCICCTDRPFAIRCDGPCCVGIINDVLELSTNDSTCWFSNLTTSFLFMDKIKKGKGRVEC